jgi:hypothetical protein
MSDQASASSNVRRIAAPIDLTDPLLRRALLHVLEKNLKDPALK